MKDILVKGLKISAAIIFGVPWLMWIISGGIFALGAMGDGEIIFGLILFVLYGLSIGLTVAVMEMDA